MRRDFVRLRGEYKNDIAFDGTLNSAACRRLFPSDLQHDVGPDVALDYGGPARHDDCRECVGKHGHGEIDHGYVYPTNHGRMPLMKSEIGQEVAQRIREKGETMESVEAVAQ